MEKYINKNGDVGVLISPGYGAGWSTWAAEEHRESMVFDRDLIKAVLEYPTDPHGSQQKRKEIADSKWPKEYDGGLSDLKVEWLRPGTDFMIHEYDGSESIWTKEDMEIYVA